MAAREATIRSRMVPSALYRRIGAEQPIADAAALLLDVQMHRMPADDMDRGRRTLLVYDERRRFVGLMHAQDIVRAVVSAWQDTPGHTTAPGAFQAQALALAALPVRGVVRHAPSIEVTATVMEAAALMASHCVTHLVVMRKGAVVGLLRHEDLYQDVLPPRADDDPSPTP